MIVFINLKGNPLHTLGVMLLVGLFNLGLDLLVCATSLRHCPACHAPQDTLTPFRVAPQTHSERQFLWLELAAGALGLAVVGLLLASAAKVGRSTPTWRTCKHQMRQHVLSHTPTHLHAACRCSLALQATPGLQLAGVRSNQQRWRPSGSNSSSSAGKRCDALRLSAPPSKQSRSLRIVQGLLGLLSLGWPTVQWV